MRSHIKFLRTLPGFSLKNIKRLEVQFDPFHPNAYSIRKFYFGVTTKKYLRTNPQCITRAQVVDKGDPFVTVQFRDDHKLILDGKYLEPSHFVQLIREFEAVHKHDAEDP